MSRIDIADVRAILSTSEDASVTDGQIQAAIDDAHIVVDGFYQSDCYLNDSDGGTARAAAVEKNLAADYVVGTSGGGNITKEKIGDASEETSTSKDGQSQYFRKATHLDCSGQLVDSEKMPAQMFTIGSHGVGNTRPSDA
jgi:hypothetical protein